MLETSKAEDTCLRGGRNNSKDVTMNNQQETKNLALLEGSSETTCEIPFIWRGKI